MSTVPHNKNNWLVEIMVVLVVIAAGALFLFANSSFLPALSHPNFEQSDTVRLQSRLKAASGNLRVLASAAQTYMMDTGRIRASYTDIVGSTTDKYIRAINPAADEDYRNIVFVTSQSQITLSSASLGTITYNM